MQVRYIKPEEAELLDAFVAAHPHGCIEQTWSWGVLQTSIPGRTAMVVLGAFEGKKLVASMLVIRQEMGKGKTWLWSPRGPLLPEKTADAKAAWLALQAACEQFAHQGGDVFLRIEPGMPASAKFELGGRVAPESYMPEHTLFLSLKGSLEAISKQMKQKGRYNIKKATKAGVYVQKSQGQELDDFYDILAETAERDGFNLHDKAFYQRFLDVLDGRGMLYVAYHEDELLGGMLVTHFGDTATYYFGASSNQHRQKMAPYLLQWVAIQNAKKAGCERYDFLGIADPDDAKDPLHGVTQFKTRFGGKAHHYAKARVFVYKPIWWWIYRLAKRLR